MKNKENGVKTMFQTVIFDLDGTILNTLEDLAAAGNWICRKLYGVQGLTWTLQTKEEYDIALKEGWIPIFENFIP